MVLVWKEFKINLVKFNEFLINNVEEIDGIAAYTEYFELIESSELSDEKKQIIINYYNELKEESEFEN